jgi:hypothetical protein
MFHCNNQTEQGDEKEGFEREGLEREGVKKRLLTVFGLISSNI